MKKAKNTIEKNNEAKSEANNTNNPNNLDTNKIDNKPKATKNEVKVKLNEIGPRLTLKLIKIEEGFFRGNVAFHALIDKTKKEILMSAMALKQKRKEKTERKKVQNDNVAKKEEIRVDKLTEEEKAAELEKEERKNKLLGKKRSLEKQKKKETDNRVKVKKRDMKHLRNLQKGK
jgi:ribosome biogenesis protein SSF1/2